VVQDPIPFAHCPALHVDDEPCEPCEFCEFDEPEPDDKPKAPPTNPTAPLATIIITVPMTAANNPVLADFNLSGAPRADKKRTPVTTHITTTTPVATSSAVFAAALAMSPSVTACAKIGRSNTPNSIKSNIFFLTPLEACLYMTQIVNFRQLLYIRKSHQCHKASNGVHNNLKYL